MIRLALALMLAASVLVFSTPVATASACGTDTSSGASVTCHLPVGSETCTAGVGADGRATASCDPPIIVCIREPCP